MSYTIDTNGCWLWQGAKNSKGYGQRWRDGRVQYVHRLAFFDSGRTLPYGHVVMHTCDVRACCNPAHLTSGTAKDNSQDMVTKGRHRTNPVRGAAHHNYRSGWSQFGKLSSDEKLFIRAWWNMGYSAIELAKTFGVNRSAIYGVLKVQP